MVQSRGLEVNGKTYTQRSAVLEGLKHNPQSSYAWNKLGETLNDEEAVKVEGFPNAHKKAHCFVRSLSLDVNHVAAWLNLGKTLLSGDHEEVLSTAAETCGISFTPRLCFKTALSLNPQCSEAWVLVGSTFTVQETRLEINDDFMTQEACYHMALRLDPKNVAGWNRLGEWLKTSNATTSVGGSVYTKKKCFLKALEQYGGHACTW